MQCAYRFEFSDEIPEEELEGEDADLLKRGVSEAALTFNKLEFLRKFANYGAVKLNNCLSANDSETMEELMTALDADWEGYEKMRQDFIDTDFDHTGMTAEKIRDREEKPIRDYVKKLLGRIVFLHFLQKKGWLGVPADKEWGDGDRDFMLKLFQNANENQKERQDNFQESQSLEYS